MRNVVEMRSLTGLRGIAALYVVVYHLFFGAAAVQPVRTFLAHGYLAVDLFFVLSGFVMAMCYQQEFAESRISAVFPVFIFKRIGRVYPLYAFVLIIYILLAQMGIIQHRDVDALAVAANSLMAQGIVLIRSISPPSWSISTEFVAYFAFPALLWVLQPFTSTKVVIAALVCFCVLAMIAVQPSVLRTAGPLDIYNTTQIYPLLRCLAGFSLGVVVFNLSAYRLATRVAGPHSTVAVAAAILALMCLPGTDLFVVAFFGVLVLFLSVGSSPIEAALSSRPVHWLGLVSYSIYLDHQVLSDALRERLSELFRSHGIQHGASLASLIILPMVVALAAVTFYAIEQPARRLFRRNAGVRMVPLSADPGAP